MKYELLEHTADVMVRCTGRNLEECFENAAYAMFDQIVDASTIEHKLERVIEICARDIEDKLYSLLSELLFILDCDSLVFNKFSIVFEDCKVRCIALGEPLNRSKHRPKSEIKAVTYHMLSISRNPPSLTVVLDV
ncbi:MAG: archease [archaeon]|nr:archease [archaeon]